MKLPLVRALLATLAGFLALAPAHAQTARTVRIGHAGPVSAPHGMGAYATDSERGAQLAVDELNARAPRIGGEDIRYELLRGDDRAHPQTAKDVAQKLVNDGVVGVVGHLNSGMSIQASLVYATAGVSQISPSATNPLFTRRNLKTTFRVIADDDHAMRALARYAVQNTGARRVLIVDVKDEYGSVGYAKIVGAPFAEGVKQAGADIVGQETADARSSDFSGLLAKIEALRPEVVFWGGMDGPAGKLLQQLAQARSTVVLAGPDGMCSPELMRLSAGAAAQVKVLCAQSEAVPASAQTRLEQFNARFEGKYGAKPLSYAKFSYDAVHVLHSAMASAQSVKPEVFGPYVGKTTLTGVTGDIAFDAKGDRVDAAVSIHTYGAQGLRQLDVVH